MKWLRDNLFGNWASGAFTLLILLLLYKTLPPLVDWAFLEAVWRPDSKACRASGSCSLAQRAGGRSLSAANGTETNIVIAAKAGTQQNKENLGPRFRGDDGNWVILPPPIRAG